MDYYTNLGFEAKYFKFQMLLDLSLFEQQMKIENFQKQVIFAGRLSKEKGIKTLIEICKNLPADIHFIILGEGPEVENIKKIESEQNNIHYLGSHEPSGNNFTHKRFRCVDTTFNYQRA